MVVASAFVIWIQRKASSSIETGILSACVDYGLAKFTYGKKMKSCSVELPIGGGLDFLNFGDGSQIWRWQR